MLLRLLAAFILIPLIELFLLFKLAAYTSIVVTLAIVVVTGVIGSVLARREGVMAWFRFRSALAEGRVPSREIQDGLMIVFAAALLLTPGLLTDALGFTMLLPAGRELLRRTLLSKFMQGMTVQVTTNGYSAQPLHRADRNAAFTVDAEAVRRKSEGSDRVKA